MFPNCVRTSIHKPKWMASALKKFTTRIKKLYVHFKSLVETYSFNGFHMAWSCGKLGKEWMAGDLTLESNECEKGKGLIRQILASGSFIVLRANYTL